MVIQFVVDGGHVAFDFVLLAQQLFHFTQVFTKILRLKSIELLVNTTICFVDIAVEFVNFECRLEDITVVFDAAL